MTLAAPIRRIQPHRLRSPEPRRPQSLLTVDLASPDGRTWRAVGGGDTLAEALAFAQDSCPTDTTWQPVSWNYLYGD